MEHTLIPAAELELFGELTDIQVVVDVGARADVDYLVLKKNITLHAFEPNPLFFQQLIDKVVELAPEEGLVFLNRFGLSDEPGMVMYNGVYQAFLGGEAPVIEGHKELELSTLDIYLEQMGIKRIDFLKIDVEGYDFKVLLGGPKAIEMTRFLQYEHWDEKDQYHTLLEERFDMEYVGYRNVLCMNKKLVSLKDRKHIKKLIKERGYAALG